MCTCHRNRFLRFIVERANDTRIRIYRFFDVNKMKSSETDTPGVNFAIYVLRKRRSIE